MHAKSFRELLVYQKARNVSRLFFEQSKRFPKEERYALTDQGRRSSRSIGAQIAEAWAKRVSFALRRKARLEMQPSPISPLITDY